MNMSQIGRWLFILGLVVCVVAGIGLIPQISNNPWVPAVLAALGLLVGLLNVSGTEATTFLIAGIALSSAATAANSILAKLGTLGPMVTGVMVNLVSFIAAAMLIVALVSLLRTARD